MESNRIKISGNQIQHMKIQIYRLNKQNNNKNNDKDKDKKKKKRNKIKSDKINMKNKMEIKYQEIQKMDKILI